MKKFRERTYRNLVKNVALESFSVAVKETDLAIYARQRLDRIARDSILRHRGHLEAFIDQNPDFLNSLVPLKLSGPAPGIARDMIEAGMRAGVGPMASVAGAIAERVGRDLLAYSSEVIVENGGDIFFQCQRPVTIGIFAGNSPLSMRLGLCIDRASKPVGVCTSSGTVGHSKSFGKADAICVVSYSCALADAAATSIGNRVKSKGDIRSAMDFGKRIAGVEAIVIIFKDKIGAWGGARIVSLEENG